MQNQDQLISLLNRPGVHSGTVLGQMLGISRVAVQKRIRALIENGLPVNAVSGKGYRLDSGIHLLEPDKIKLYLDDVARLESLEVLQSVDSTNTHLLGQSILPKRARVCAAEVQNAGRGRRGNDWQSAPYRNIMLSLSWGFSRWPETITGLGLAVALVVAEQLNADLGTQVEIKWPNDLMMGADKLAGVLIDVAGESSGACNAVIGLGLNIHQPDWSVNTGTHYRWTDLAAQGIHVNRNVLIGKMVTVLISVLMEFEKNGFEPLTDRWNVLSSYANKKIRVGAEGEFIEGRMVGVNAAGALLVESGDGIVHRVSDSGASVRLM